MEQTRIVTDGGELGSGGDGGIRTLDRALQPYNGLANRRLQPLGHVSRAEKRAETYARRLPSLQALGAQAWRALARRGSAPLVADNGGLGCTGSRGEAVEPNPNQTGTPGVRRARLASILHLGLDERPCSNSAAVMNSSVNHKSADRARPNRRRPRPISWSADA
jgi:hypothetical protein